MPDENGEGFASCLGEVSVGGLLEEVREEVGCVGLEEGGDGEGWENGGEEEKRGFGLEGREEGLKG